MKKEGKDKMVFTPKKHKILSVKKITGDVNLFRIKSSMNPLPGKFFEVSILGAGEAPLASCSYNNQYLDLLVKNAGGVTSKIFELKKNDSIFIRGAYGRGFPVEELKGKDLILVAGGTGVAPVTSLIEYIEKNRKYFGDISIYFGFKNEDYILLKDRIEKWNKKFNLSVCLNEVYGKNKYKKGFVNEILKNEKPWFKKTENTVALLCGPEVMMKSVSLELNNLGIKDNQIYWSMERRMECAFGSCGRCLIQDVYVCKDGPVFRYDKIKSKLENEEVSNKYGR
jgi:anaerobic sulfite reductase subunit B